jgi:anaerobic selenocysteine-containing dehydrogenase
MAGVPLRVHQDIILTDQMFIAGEGDVILLPAKTRYEQDDGGTETSTERRVMFSPELPRQVGEARAEWKILRDLAARVYPEKANLLGCEDGWKMREEIAQVVPFYEGVQRLRTTGDAFQYGGPHLCAGGVFPTADGKAHLSAVNLPETRRQGLFHVSTRRGKQFNTLIYAEIDPLTGAARDAIFMNGEDAGERHLKQGDRIALVNDLGRYEGRVFLADIAPGNLQVMWPEGNVIIRRGVVDRGGGVPDYNALVRIEEAAAEDARHFGVRGNSAALEPR